MGVQHQDQAVLKAPPSASQKRDLFACQQNDGHLTQHHADIDYGDISMSSSCFRLVPENLGQRLGERDELSITPHYIPPSTPTDVEIESPITSLFEQAQDTLDQFQGCIDYHSAKRCEARLHDPMVRRSSTSLFEMPIPPRDLIYCEDVATAPSTPQFIDQNGYRQTRDGNGIYENPISNQPAIEFGRVIWWASTDLQPTARYFPADSGMDSAAWMYYQTSTLAHPLIPSVYTLPSSTPSPRTIDLPPGSPSPASGQTGHSISSNDDGLGESQCRPSSQKRRKSSTETVAHNDQPQSNTVSQKRESNVPDPRPPFRGRDRHRRASARNWQKQKQQSADLESAKDTAEALNSQLHREHARVSSQVMDLKNALMDHAMCNHPAINGWLRCQAANYVFNSGGGVDVGWESEEESGAGEIPVTACTAGWASTTCI
ncbi:hypothetical protein CORC01_02630 [Colletotrichum orchidophilum]|uniref:BZIP domain-containing protein n=1 Tax=Colletotrichum orchidophilum TaxID=1209926 RepID=A0A1G4BKT5_9PEZI|nr:uncharacterized protein CORC01_02630 [Colletotrichum orchidophilum]OHF02051.1 hypothetical protein CORC01_02630 [Colletotrichum orchidophilum]